MTSPPEPLPLRWPERADLLAVFGQKYGEPGHTGWGPAMRLRFDYFTPDDVYEAVVERLLPAGGRWLDVGCGRDLFPFNRPLSVELAARSALLVGVDPAPTLDENDLVHEKVRGTIDDYRGGQEFDLVTLRMVAEHVDDPPQVVASLARCTRPGGLCVIYTPYRWSPVPILTALLPFGLHQPVKRVLWRTDEKDTFPTRFRMNTRAALRRHMAAGGFGEERFALLDDCRTLSRFRWLQWGELAVRRVLRAVGLGYPERCVLGVYRRSASAATS